MPLFIQHHPRIMTKNREGLPNGWLVPIYNIHDGLIDAAQYPRQVYLTVIAPGEVKGPHLHLKRWGLFTCVRGNVKVVVRTLGGYEEYLSGDDFQYATVQVPAGVPAALQNISDKEAYVLNMPSPEWRAEDQDEHAVFFDDYEFIFPAGKE
jgi:dTDP-4-dehydrorhamnose 3,5-epimerase